jgi:hypothetical protein
MRAMRHPGLTTAIFFGCALFGAASAGAEGGAADLPPDYRAQIVRLQLSQHPNFRDLLISYSDPGRVRVRGTAPELPVKEMTAVVFAYTPHAPDGSIYLMDVIGAALFEGGHFVRTFNPDDPLVEWVDGQPRPHADSAADRQAERARALAEADRWHDPVAGPILRRQMRRELWVFYDRPIGEMGLPAATAAELWPLLLNREDEPREARYRALHAGVDPFSGAMAKTVAAAQAAADQKVKSLLGGTGLDQLEYLRAAFSWESQINREEGSALVDAGLPLSPAQLLAFGKIEEDVRNPRRNGNFAAEAGRRDPATGISALDQKMLDRTAAVLAAGQERVLRNFVENRAKDSRPRPRSELLDLIRGNVRRDQGAELAVEGCPLTDAQFEAVARAYWETHTIKNPDYKAMQAKVADAGTGLTGADEAFLARTAVIVSPRQQEALRNCQADLAFLAREIAKSRSHPGA